MKRYGLVLITVAILVLGLIVAAPTSRAHANGGNAYTRPIEDFVSTQGTFCIDDGNGGCRIYVPPVANFIGWFAPATGFCASIDYAGLADDYLKVASNGSLSLGTTSGGSITERPLADGRAEVEVRLRTHNALTWVIESCEGDTGYADGVLLLGYRAPDVLSGNPPALCDSFLKIKFINVAPGAPLPDLMQLFSAPAEGQEVMSMSVRCNAEGTLHDDAGGTPGKATIVQNGLFMTGFHGAVSDGFPAEFIKLQSIGKGPTTTASGDAVGISGLLDMQSQLFLPMIRQ